MLAFHSADVCQRGALRVCSKPNEPNQAGRGVDWRYSMRKPSNETLLIGDLLAFATMESPPLVAERILAMLLSEPDATQISQVFAAGMAPLLFHAVRNHVDQLPVALREALLGADLTAQVWHGARVDTALSVIDICAGLGIRPVLLKGISISEQHYPEGHLRPMGDIDILVPAESRQLVEAAMLNQGYVPLAGDYMVNEHSHHAAPLYHPKFGVWVEIHWALFRGNTSLGKAGIFARKAFPDHLVATGFRGRQVDRLSGELQLVYVASSWVKDLQQGFHPSSLVPLFDAIYLLRASDKKLTWEGLSRWVGNETAVASLYLLLKYLGRHQLWVPPARVLSDLAVSQRAIGPVELGILQAMLDRYLLEGRPFTRLFHSSHVWRELIAPGFTPVKLARMPWRIAFPPTSPGRFTVPFQRERIARLFHRLKPS